MGYGNVPSEQYANYIYSMRRPSHMDGRNDGPLVPRRHGLRENKCHSVLYLVAYRTGDKYRDEHLLLVEEEEVKVVASTLLAIIVVAAAIALPVAIVAFLVANRVDLF